MKIIQLDIRDFGVFQGEKLENLGGGIIVIGGANRSGKTSLMQIIRNMPYGFSQNVDLPPPKFQYDVRGDLELERGKEVNVLLKGFSKPEIVYKNTTDYSLDSELYNIDKATYRELFTISLDELNKSSDKEDNNLQAMLLGAGFKHIVKIPYLTKELREKASVIGGTRGNPSTKMFKPYTENIKKGVEGRKKSLDMLDTFVQKKNTALKLQGAIILKEKELIDSDNSIIKLEMLKHNYELNESKKNIEKELNTHSFSLEDMREYNIEKAKALKTQYIKELEQYNNDNYEFQNETLNEVNIKELLIENKLSINSFYNGLSGFKLMSKNLLIIKNEYYEKTQALMNKVKKANDNWTSFKLVVEINCDEVQQNILTGNIEKFRKIDGETTICNKKIEEIRIEREILEKQIKPYDVISYSKKYFYLTLLFIILGIALFTIDNLLGYSIIIIGAIGTVLYLFINYSNAKVMLNRNLEAKAGMDNLEIVFDKTTRQLRNLDENLVEMNNIMDEYRDILKLDARVSVEGIKDYFKTAAFLKEEIVGYYLLQKKLNNEFSDLCEYLKDIKLMLNKFTNTNSKNLEEIELKLNSQGINLQNIGNICNDIFLKVEVLYKKLLLVEKTERSLSKLNILEVEISEFLDCTNSQESPLKENIILYIEKYIDKGEKYIKYTNGKNELKIIQDKLLQGLKGLRINNILCDENIKFDEIKDKNVVLLKILEDLYKQYVSFEELKYELEAINSEKITIVSQLDILKNERQTTKDELQALNSDDKLLEYDRGIREARAQLRPLAESYAVYNTAALFLEKIRERFLVNTKDKLLKGASNILSEITSGEYKDIIPMENLMQGDFKTVLRDESIVESSKALSRGTKEQLFLAVRISRIKEIVPSLPVIFDDSFVNFDIAHTKNTVRALVQLSNTHQIFVLTCHASLVELIRLQSAQVQYIKLDKGKFTKVKGEELGDYLKEL